MSLSIADINNLENTIKQNNAIKIQNSNLQQENTQYKNCLNNIRNLIARHCFDMKPKQINLILTMIDDCLEVNNGRNR